MHPHNDQGLIEPSASFNRGHGWFLRCATDIKPVAPVAVTWHPDVAGTTINVRIQEVPVSSRRSDSLPPDAASRAIPDTAVRPIVVPTPPKIQWSKELSKAKLDRVLLDITRKILYNKY